MIVRGGKASLRAAATAASASDLPSLLAKETDFSSLNRRPLNSTRNPNPADCSVRRLPSHVLVVALGGGLSQKPVYENVWRRILDSGRRDSCFDQNPGRGLRSWRR